MPDLKAADIQAITGVHEDKLESWIDRLSLSTQYETTVAGRARRFSRDNALELGVIATLVKQGSKPKHAAEVAAQLFEIMKTKKPRGVLTVFPNGRYTISDKPPGPTIMKYASCVCVNIGQLEREIDAYLAGVDKNDEG
jgi:MerR HTH family regulatory protein